MNRRGILALLGAAALTGCARPDGRTPLVVQRIFGDCRAHVPKFGAPIDNPNGECELITVMLDRFEADNPDIRLSVNPVAWPGYDQLSAQIAADDAPDLVTMHMAVIPDFQTHNLLLPMTEGLKAIGVTPDQFTPAARAAITMDGDVYGLPFDAWTQLFHINMNLFRRAGLVTPAGRPILPHSPTELLQQARQFRAATGKPYLVQSTVNETAAYARNLYTYLLAQNQVIFPDPRHIRLNTRQARAIVGLFKQIYDEDLTTKNQEYAAATATFVNGGGGVYIVGTWMIGTFDNEAAQPGRPLYKGYAVMPYPELFGGPAAFVDGHAWVMPKKARTPAQLAAAYRLVKFLAQHEVQWTQSGHLTSMEAVALDPHYRDQPHRADLVAITSYGRGLPISVQRQFAIQEIVSDEMASAIAGLKPIDRALGDAERRIDDMLTNLS